MNQSSLRPWPLLVAVLVTLMACSAAPVSGPASSSAPLPTAAIPSALPGETAFDQVVAMLGPEGEVSPELALQAFALAVAPIPGVTPPEGPNQWPDADAAVAWVLQVWDQLPASQQTSIEQALAGMRDPFSENEAPVSGAGITLAALRPMTAAAKRDCGLFGPGEVDTDVPMAVLPFLDMMTEAAGSIAGHLGRASLPRLAVCLVPTETLAGPSLTRAYDAESARLGLPASCSIFLNADIVGGLGDDLGYLMAFNTFLCFSTTADPAESLASSRARNVRSWVLGGTAAWAGATVASEIFGAAGGEHLAEVWGSYLTEPGTDLYLRTTSAIGFLSQVDQDLPSAWDVIDEMLLGADGLDSFYAATGRRQSFIDLWAGGYFRDASRGPDWDIYGPGITTDTAEAGTIEVANGAAEEMAAPAFAVATADLTTSADVTVLAGNHLRVHDGVQDLKDVRNRAYCTMEGGANGCICPPGTPGALRPPLPSLNVEAKLALTGMEFGATAEIRGISLAEYCGPPTGDGATWHLDSPASYSGGPSHVVVDAYTCASISGPWKATMHVTHDPAVPGDPPLDRTVEFSWSFDSSGTAQPTIGPYEDTVFGRTHTLVYYPLLQLNAESGTVTVIRLDASEDGSPRVDATYQLERAGEPVPLDLGRPSGC